MEYKEAIELLHPETSRNAIWKIADEENAIKKIEEALVMACEAMQELQEYKQLGTLEEVREALEKQKAKKTVIEDICRNGVDFYGIVYQEKASVYKCPACDSFVGFVGENQCISYCACCGQKFDWTEAEE